MTDPDWSSVEYLRSLGLLVRGRVHPARKDCKKNPNCLLHTYKGKSSGESRQIRGLKQAVLDVRVRELRESAGLTNVGKTCYVNALIQSLFAIESFRNGIRSLQINDSSEHGKVLLELRRLFALLEFSFSPSIDSTRFIEALRIPFDVQQDFTEFSRLLLCLVEDCCRLAEEPSIESLVPSHFEGQSRYCMTCCRCSAPSIPSAIRFYDLQVAIPSDGGELELLVSNLLEDELMSGKNQVFCSICGSKEDSIRTHTFEVLPPVLHIHLNRSVFDSVAGKKKKVRAVVSFPRVLILPEDDSKATFELCGVINHSGGVDAGHYTAILRHSDSDVWKKFDDRNVMEVKPPWEAFAVTGEDRCAISDAYVLIYFRVDENRNFLFPDTVNLPLSPSLEFEIAEKNSECMRMLESAEKALSREAEAGDAEQQRRREIAELIEVLSCVSEPEWVGKEAEADEGTGGTNQSFFWIPSDWWGSFVMGKLEPLDVTDICCDHGLLSPDPDILLDSKRVPERLWDAIVEKVEVSYPPEGECGMTDDSICPFCALHLMTQGENEESWKKSKELLEALLAGEVPSDDDEKGGKDDEERKGKKTKKKVEKKSLRRRSWRTDSMKIDESECVVVSRSWLNGLLASSVRDLSEFGPSDSIMCPHGELSPDTVHDQLRIRNRAWDFLVSLFSGAGWKPVLGPMRLCSRCDRVFQEEKSIESKRATELSRERRRVAETLRLVRSLAQGVPLSIRSIRSQETAVFYPFPTEWIQSWAESVERTSDRADSKPSPSLDADVCPLFCEHNDLVCSAADLADLLWGWGSVSTKAEFDGGTEKTGDGLLFPIPEKDAMEFEKMHGWHSPVSIHLRAVPMTTPSKRKKLKTRACKENGGKLTWERWSWEGVSYFAAVNVDACGICDTGFASLSRVFRLTELVQKRRESVLPVEEDGRRGGGVFLVRVHPSGRVKRGQDCFAVVNVDSEDETVDVIELKIFEQIPIIAPSSMRIWWRDRLLTSNETVVCTGVPFGAVLHVFDRGGVGDDNDYDASDRPFSKEIAFADSVFGSPKK